MSRFMMVVAVLLLCMGQTFAERTTDYGKLPLSFEANQGQADARVKFVARGPGYGVLLTGRDAVLTLAHGGKNTTLRMTLPGADPNPTVEGRDPLPGQVNYFIGNDPSQWRTNVRT